MAIHAGLSFKAGQQRVTLEISQDSKLCSTIWIEL